MYKRQIYDALSGLIAEQAGARAVYLSGASIAYTRFGRSDVGLVSASEVHDTLAAVTDRIQIPVIVDADTGFGNALNVQRTIRNFERAGAAAIQIEDQSFPKRCGHLDGKTLISKDEMVGKIKAAIDARKETNTLIIARTDANSVEGLNKTVERVKAYEDAGADIIFPEAMKDEKEFEQIRKHTKVSLLANMTEFGKSKLLSANTLEKLGYNIIIYPVSTQRLAMKNVEDGLKVIFKDGHQNNIIDRMQTRKRLYELVEYEKYNTPDKKMTDFKTDGHE